MKRQIVNILTWVDFQTDGIRLRLIMAASVLQVFLAPMWDRVHPAHKVAGNLEPVTLLSTLLFITLLAALAGGRLVALSSQEDGPSQRIRLREIVGVAQRLVQRAWALVQREPLWIRAAQASGALFVLLLALRGAFGLLRWLAWKSINGVEVVLPAPALWEPLRQGLERVYYLEHDMRRWAVWLSVGCALLMLPMVLRKPRRTSHPAGLREPDALATLDPLIERKDPGGHALIGSFFNGDIVSRLLAGLARWSPDRSVRDENSCRDHIALFLQRRGYQVGAERWLASGTERRRVDLLVDESIPIELKYEIHDKSMGERDRVREQVESYARIWGSSGPVLLLLVRTRRTDAGRYREPAQLWNGRLDGLRAPIVVVADS